MADRPFGFWEQRSSSPHGRCSDSEGQERESGSAKSDQPLDLGHRSAESHLSAACDCSGALVAAVANAALAWAAQMNCVSI
jgi:hypothetical protein